MTKNVRPVKHPIQPLVEDEHGVVRFKENKIVSYLLDCCKTGQKADLNDIARLDFSQEDREQFAQLIGYSHAGASDLSYMSETVLVTAANIYVSAKQDIDQRDVRIEYLEHKLKSLRVTLADALADFFEIHPDDLKGA